MENYERFNAVKMENANSRFCIYKAITSFSMFCFACLLGFKRKKKNIEKYKTRFIANFLLFNTSTYLLGFRLSYQSEAQKKKMQWPNGKVTCYCPPLLGLSETLVMSTQCHNVGDR